MTSQSQAPSYQPETPILSIAAKMGDPVDAAQFPKATLRFRNDRAAASIGLDGLDDDQWVQHFGRFEPLPDNLNSPLALRYHGHQFRVYNPEIGDGRGFLFAQMRDGGRRLMDLGTKGSGTTPWSRAGDGRLTMKGAARELLATEMLEALGVNTSKTFSIVETHEELWRSDEPSPTRSAVMVRLSHGHIRFGSFQRLAYESDSETMAALVRYCLTHYYDDSDTGSRSDAENAAHLFDLVAQHMATLVASYMVAGFVHGVLNTDNMNISGESFDYGPWRFAQYWQPGFTAAYFDHQGLYCFARQPEAFHWNLGQLATCLRMLCEAEPLIETLDGFGLRYQQAMMRQFCWRLGVTSRGDDEDRELVQAGEKLLLAERHTIDEFFFHSRKMVSTGTAPDMLKPNGDEKHDDALANWIACLEPYQAVANGCDHEYWQGEAPQGMAIEEVEALWEHIAERDDWEPLMAKVTALREMAAAHKVT
ncbi:protein adenylyltransferase SelO family protein [Alterisphingorhabdus coralli]|uniref:YdiU family protein n=1 Tax=Alterisphingorhabdus coralli TaxID=3071408 RepID=A0AA97FBD7_9SPHN|nr:YdiU family protein [Parasphingorhabdus sp. SCSIO 66989]WOE75955.1 YdiU family protein [Parasphingorhabdus sp. SCSIO 66989]